MWKIRKHIEIEWFKNSMQMDENGFDGKENRFRLFFAAP